MAARFETVKDADTIGEENLSRGTFLRRFQTLEEIEERRRREAIVMEAVNDGGDENLAQFSNDNA